MYIPGRVAICVYEKIAQSVGQPIFCQIHNLKVAEKMWTTSVIFKKLPKVNTQKGKNLYKSGHPATRVWHLLPWRKTESRLPTMYQSDQIVHFFAYSAIVYLGHFFKYRSSKIFGLLFPMVKVMCILIWTKSGLGNNFGDFDANSSGHSF
jgi:hypothetical protein